MRRLAHLALRRAAQIFASLVTWLPATATGATGDCEAISKLALASMVSRASCLFAWKWELKPCASWGAGAMLGARAHKRCCPQMGLCDAMRGSGAHVRMKQALHRRELRSSRRLAG